MDAHVIAQLSPYMDGELDPAERAQVEAHLRGCAGCARHLEELRAVEAAARDLPLRVPAGYFEAFPARVGERLAAARRQERRRRMIVPAWIGAAAAAVVLAVITPRLLREPPADVSRDVASEAAAQRLPAVSAPAAPAQAEAPASSAEARLAHRSASKPALPPPPPPAEAADKADERLRRRFDGRDELPSARAKRADGPPMATLPAPLPAAAPPTATASPAAANEAARDYAQAPPAGSLGYSAPPAKREAEAGPAAGGRVATAEEAEARPDKDGLALRRRAQTPSEQAPLEKKTAPDKEARFKGLLAQSSRSAAEARAARDAWRTFVRDDPAGPRADEARVRAIEAGAEAWRLGRDEADRADAEREARQYLARTDARQSDRVRAALAKLRP